MLKSRLTWTPSVMIWSWVALELSRMPNKRAEEAVHNSHTIVSADVLKIVSNQTHKRIKGDDEQSQKIFPTTSSSRGSTEATSQFEREKKINRKNKMPLPMPIMKSGRTVQNCRRHLSEAGRQPLNNPMLYSPSIWDAQCEMSYSRKSGEGVEKKGYWNAQASAKCKHP